MSIEPRRAIDLTAAEYRAMTPRERRRWRDELLREWEQNYQRELAEDERADAERGEWGE